MESQTYVKVRSKEESHFLPIKIIRVKELVMSDKSQS